MSARRRPRQLIRYDGPSDEFITGWGLSFVQGQVHELDPDEAEELLTYPGHLFAVHVPEGPAEAEGGPVAGPVAEPSAPADVEAAPEAETGGE
jgi:hypothetical protein